jgi:hypothetical protein
MNDVTVHGVRGMDGKVYASAADASAAADKQLAAMSVAYADAPAQRIACETAALDKLLSDPMFQDRKLRGDRSADYEEALIRTRISAAKRGRAKSVDAELARHRA